MEIYVTRKAMTLATLGVTRMTSGGMELLQLLLSYFYYYSATHIPVTKGCDFKCPVMLGWTGWGATGGYFFL